MIPILLLEVPRYIKKSFIQNGDQTITTNNAVINSCQMFSQPSLTLVTKSKVGRIVSRLSVILFSSLESKIPELDVN